MKGLLHRLAARAGGKTVPVRSDARLPFGSTELAWGETVETGAARERPVAAPALTPAQSRAATTPSVQPDDSEHDTLVPMLDRLLTPSAQPALRPPSRTNQLPPAPQNAHARTDAQQALVTTPPSALVAPLAQAGEPDPRLPPRLVEGGLADATQAAPVQAEPRHALAQLTPTIQASLPSLRLDVPMRSSSEPPLMMPAATTERGPTPAPAPAAVAAAGREPFWSNVAAETAADEPTEVHIHIGRIEVTAVHEAPAQRPKPKARQAPMSLDAYLAARSKT